MGYLAKPDDYKLVDLVKQNRHLYDKSHSDYRDRAKNEMTWNTFATVLGVSEEALRKRFRNLRDRFTKEKRHRKDMKNDPTLPLIFKKMLFLWDHLQHRQQRDDGSSLNESNQSAETLFQEIEEQVQFLEGSELDEAFEDPSPRDVNSLQNQIVYVVDESGNLIPHKATPLMQENNSDNDKIVIKQPNVFVVRYESEGKQSELEDKETWDLGTAKQKLGSSIGEVDSSVESEGNPKANSAKEVDAGRTNESLTAKHSIDPGEVINELAHCDNRTESPSIISLGEKKKEADPLIGEAEQNLDGNSSRTLQSEVTDTSGVSNILPMIVSTCSQRVDPVHSYCLPKNSSVRLRQKKILQARKRKIMEKNSARDKHRKIQETTEKVSNKTDESSIRKVSPFQSCNEAFCSMVKHYLDKITAPDRLSAARLQILTILHNELYSTYS